MGLQIEQTTFMKWREAYCLRLGQVEMVVVTQIGPRILSLSIGDGPNLLFVDEGMKVGPGSGENAWHIYGGHRIWVAPESDDSYAPDNMPCEVQIVSGQFTALAPVSARTGLQKRLSVSACDGRLSIVHGVRNMGETVYSGAVWAITCVAPKGVVAFPWGRGGSWDLKKIMYWNRWIASATDVTSRQWQPGPDLFRVVPTGEVGKVGSNPPEGWVALCRDDATFIKSRRWVPDAHYPDEDCSLQVYTCPQFIEMETLSPLTTFYPGAEVTHEETWTLSAQMIDPADGGALRALVA